MMKAAQLVNEGREAQQRGATQQAAALFRESLMLDEQRQDARYALACMQLAEGNWSAGWAEYAQATATAAVPLVSPAQISGHRCILLQNSDIAEYLFFLRFVPELVRQGVTVSAVVEAGLVECLQRTGWFDQVYARETFRQSAEGQVGTVMSAAQLPGYLGIESAETQPLSLSCLESRQMLVLQRLARYPKGPVLGISWRDEGGMQVDPEYLLRRVANFEGLLVLMQDDVSEQELSRYRQLLGKRLLHYRDVAHDEEDLLALLVVLDHYVGVPNTFLYLRTSLQKAATVFVPYPGVWFWMANSTHASPWFPGTALLRQTCDGQWPSQAITLA